MNEINLGAGEVLRGALAIAAYYSELLGEPVTDKNIYYWFARGYVPGGKFAGILTSTKTKIREKLTEVLR